MSRSPFLLAVLLPFLAGCATIFSDDDYTVSVQSTPAGADFVISDRQGVEVHRGTTPEQVRLEADAGYFRPARYTLRFSSPGHPETTRVLRGKIDGWYFGNILLGGLIGGVIVDPLTGAMWKLDRTVHVELATTEP